MATQAGTKLWTDGKNEVDAVIDENGNTIYITPVTLSTEPNSEGLFESTLGTKYSTSAVNYDTYTLKRDFGQSVILNGGESMLIIKSGITINDNDIITIDNIDYIPLEVLPLKAGDVLIAQMLRIGIKQN